MSKEFLEKAVVELAYKFDKKSYHECLKRYGDHYSMIQNFWSTNMYTLYTYIWTPTLITLTRSRCSCGVIMELIEALTDFSITKILIKMSKGFNLTINVLKKAFRTKCNQPFDIVITPLIFIYHVLNISAYQL